MFLLRIAGDVAGEKRNVEVTFPRRPSLQQVCLVAETILPLGDRRRRRAWRPPWAAAPTQGGDGVVAPPPRPPGPSCDVPYVVESLVHLHRATHEWEELSSACQLTSGAQVYCFSPLQRRRVAVARRGSCPVSASAAPARGSHVDTATAVLGTHRQSSPAVVTGVVERWADPDRPGVLPEPQQRLVWDCPSPAVERAEGVERGLPSGADVSRACSHATHAVSPPAAAPSSPLSSGNCRRHTGDSAWSAPPSAAAVPGPHPADQSEATPSSVRLTDTSYAPPPRRAIAGLVQSTSPPTHEERSSLVEEHHASRPRRPQQRHATASWLRDNQPALLAHVPPAWSAVLRSADSGGHYTQLGSRLELLFDVLVRLDPQEGGGAVRRSYILLRDLYLLASCLALPAHSDGVHDSLPAVDVTAELRVRRGWSWDDVLRHADKDRDGCIAYREWISFGVEHPDVVQLLCRAVHALLTREAAASSSRQGRLGPFVAAAAPPRDRRSSSPTSASSCPVARHPCGRTPYSEEFDPFPGTLRACRVHPGLLDGTSVEGSGVALAAREPRRAPGARCDACRELRIQLSAARLSGRESEQGSFACLL